MEVFEVHITGDESIIENAVKLGNLKTITVDLLRPDRSVLRTEYMTALVTKCDQYQTCHDQTMKLVEDFKNLGTKIIRVKIECPPYQHYFNSSLYMESHFKMIDDLTFIPFFPTSRNQKKNKLLGTDRTYDKADYKRFSDTHQDNELELCLYDSFIDEDLDWLSLPWLVNSSSGE